MPSILPICTSCDDRFTPHCGVMIASLLDHCSPGTQVHVHILDGGISDVNKDRLASLSSIRPFTLHFHRMNEADFDGIKVGTWPMSANYRFKVASALPGVGKILYLDSDIVILNDLSPLIDNYPEGAWCCGVPDAVSRKNIKRLGLDGDAPYVNSGVLAIDLEAWRQHGLEQKMLDYARLHTDTLKYQDQDVINVVLRGHIHILPLRWNSQYLDRRYTPPGKPFYRDSYRNPAIIHYVTSEKPWLALSGAPRKSYYLDYLSRTPWHSEIREQWKRELKTLSPYKRRWKRWLKGLFHFHVKRGERFIRLFGITLVQDDPSFC